MGKHEPPPFRMKVENGRLVPAAAWDQERLLTYRNGSYLSVQITQQKNRKLERKYWAILHKVIDTCGVKWRTAEDAHKAIRWAVGAVEPFLTADGKMRAELKSTSTMEDPEYGLFYSDAMEFLHRLTGVDPETLGAEAADVGEDDHHTSDGALPGTTDDGSDGNPALPSTVAANLSEPASGGPAEGDAPVTADPGKQDHGGSAASPSILSDADREWLKATAKMLWAATGVGEQDVLARQFKGIRESATPAEIGEKARSKANAIYQKCKLVCFGEATASDTLPLIAGIVGCEVRELA